MTLLGVGAGGGNYAAPANTSLGSIGLGYIYTDWLAQINYTTPDYSGLKFTVGIFDPLEPARRRCRHARRRAGIPRQGRVHAAATCICPPRSCQQKQEGVTDAADFDSTAFDIGGKYKRARWSSWRYYYSGKGVGTTGALPARRATAPATSATRTASSRR